MSYVSLWLFPQNELTVVVLDFCVFCQGSLIRKYRTNRPSKTFEAPLQAMDELDMVMIFLSFYYIYLVAILQRARLPLWLFIWKKQNYELSRYFLHFRSHRGRCNFFFCYMYFIETALQCLFIKIQTKLQRVTRENKIDSLCPEKKKDGPSLSGKSNPSNETWALPSSAD